MEASEIRTSHGMCGYRIGDKHFVTTHQSINGCTVFVEADTESEARRQAMCLKSFFVEALPSP